MPPAATIASPAPERRWIPQRRDQCKVIGGGQAIGTANRLGDATPSEAVPLIEPRQ